MSQASPPVPHASEPDAGDRLESWKEIASYLKREVRTVQRWEKTESLPVHRHQHDKLASVSAYKSELDAWRRARQNLVNSLDPVEELATPDPPAKTESAETPAPASNLGTRNDSAPPVRRGLFRVLALALVASLLVAGGYKAWEHYKGSYTPGKTRLIVLPFRCLGNLAPEGFCDGLTQAMTTQLGRLDPDHLAVIAPNTASRIKDYSIEKIGNELGVQYVLEGSVTRSGDKVRIDSHLTQVSDQTLKHAIVFIRDVGDILALQNDVAQSIAYEIRLTLSPAERARLESAGKVDPEAADAYLLGLVAWNSRTPSGLVKSIDHFNEAIGKSPNFALAYAGLADSYSIASSVPTGAMDPRDVMAKAKEAAENALRLDPKSAEAHAALGLVNQTFEWDFPGAEQEYQRALEINPSYGSARQWHALLLMSQGRNEEALAEIERARSLDPLSPVIDSSRIQAYYFARQYDRAVAEARKALEVEPAMLVISYHLGQALLQQGNYAEAISVLSKASNASGDSDLFVMALGHANAVAGNRAEALKAISELTARSQKRYLSPIYIAGVYTGLGDRDKAIQWLEKAFNERTEYLIFFKVEPMADPLRSDPRFLDLLKRIGLS